MPNFNGTGPEGKGPKTGRGMGKCPSNSNNIVERGNQMTKQNGGKGRGGNGRGMGPRNRGKNKAQNI